MSPKPAVTAKQVLTLPEVIYVEGEEKAPVIESVEVVLKGIWAFGANVLLRSVDGDEWYDPGARLKRDGCFAVSSVTHDSSGVRIFARNKHGLRCYGWDEWDQDWKVLFSVATESSGVLAAWTSQGLVMAAMHHPVPGNVCMASPAGDGQTWHRGFRGVPIHLQMTTSGAGLCAAWGIDITDDNGYGNPSAVYATDDGGMNWRVAATIETQLLNGVAAGKNATLVGGTDGTLGVVDGTGIKVIWRVKLPVSRRLRRGTTSP